MTINNDKWHKSRHCLLVFQILLLISELFWIYWPPDHLKSYFFRINYPLQLNYQGIPNPIELSKTINNLRRQLKLYENKNGAEFRMNEISRLDQENKTLTKEKEVLALEILKLRSEEKHRNRRVDSLPNVSALKESGNAQEIKILKQMMKSIEENSIKEKNFFQRAIIKKDEEINLLKYQINQVKSSEKSLMSQLKYSEDKFRNKNVSRNSSRNTSIDHSFRKKWVFFSFHRHKSGGRKYGKLELVTPQFIIKWILNGF